MYIVIFARTYTQTTAVMSQSSGPETLVGEDFVNHL